MLFDLVLRLRTCAAAACPTEVLASTQSPPSQQIISAMPQTQRFSALSACPERDGRRALACPAGVGCQRGIFYNKLLYGLGLRTAGKVSKQINVMHPCSRQPELLSLGLERVGLGSRCTNESKIYALFLQPCHFLPVACGCRKKRLLRAQKMQCVRIDC